MQRVAQQHDGTLSPAGIGFCRKNNVDENTISFKEKNDGIFLYAQKVIPGRDIVFWVADFFKESIYALQANLKMKWLSADISPSFIRPVRSLCAMVENKVIPIEMFGLKSRRFVFGQRVLSPGPHRIENARDYIPLLEKSSVVSSADKRRQIIQEEIKKVERILVGNVILDEELLNKCIGLSESPHVLYGEFDKSYLRLPLNLIVSVLKEHMNYFCITNKNGGLLPYYIGISNYECNCIDLMVEGTRNVVEGRLDDGAFYYDTDLSTPILDLNEGLKTSVFQEGMGSLFDKEQRIREMVVQNNLWPTEFSKEALVFAATYCKADLKTGCVQEFPDEMQGVMGGVLIRAQNAMGDKNLSNLAAEAIAQHYAPMGAGASLPTSFYGTILSLFDKLDSLCMMINAGVEIKGNKDPLGMRRLGLSVLRLIGIRGEDNAYSTTLFSLIDLWKSAAKLGGFTLKQDFDEKFQAFIFERIKFQLRTEFDPHSIEAISKHFLTRPFHDIRNFIKAIDSAIRSDGGEFLNAIIPYKRARSLLEQNNVSTTVNPELFQSDAEIDLYKKLLLVEEESSLNFKNSNYKEFLNCLGSLAKPLARFFDSVMVNDPNPQLKQNRLAMLLRIRFLYENIADFSVIQVQ